MTRARRVLVPFGTRPEVVKLAPVVSALTAAGTVLFHEEAGMIAGIIARRHGLGPDARRRLVNDALLVLTARTHGLTLLTRNRGDMDLIGQVAGVESVLFYKVA